MSKMNQLERAALYEEVWSEPMSRLAPKYGLSGNGLKKICAKLHIPVPPRGYWARVQHGQKAKKQPLPGLKSGQADTYTLQLSENQLADKMVNKEESLSSEAMELINAARERSIKIAVPAKLTAPHPLVRQTQELLKTTKPDDYGVLRPRRGDYLNIRVSPECLTRALLIMDTTIKLFESLGLKSSLQTAQNDRTPSTRVDIFGESIQFSLEEKVQRTDHIPTDAEKKEMVRHTWFSPPKWHYRPSGKLILRYDPWGWGHDGLRKSWAEGPSKPLESMVGDFVIGGIKIGAALQQQRRISEEKERLRQQELQIRAELERQKQLELERLRLLENQAEKWSNSQKLRDFINAVMAAYSGQTNDAEFRQKLEKWLAWARQHADNIDPLKNGCPF